MAGFDDTAGGENPLDIPFDDFDGSIINGSEPEPGPAASRKSKSKSKLSSASASSLPGGGSSGGGGVSEHDSRQDPTDAQDDVLHMDMDFVRLPHLCAPSHSSIASFASQHAMRCERRCVITVLCRGSDTSAAPADRILATDTAG